MMASFPLNKDTLIFNYTGTQSLRNITGFAFGNVKVLKIEEFEIYYDTKENISYVGNKDVESAVFGSKLTELEDYIVAVFLGMTGVCSILLNALVAFVCYKNKKKLISTDYFIINLAVSDIFLPVFGFPFVISSSLKHRWVFGELGCHAYGFLGFFCGVVSMSTLAVMSIGRYVNVCHVDKKKYFKDKTRHLIIFTYGYALLWSVPPIIGWGGYGVEPHGTSCTIDWRNNRSFVTLMLLLCIILPVTVILGCYINVVIFLRRIRNNMTKWRIQQKVVFRRREGYLIKITFTMCFSFVGMWTPYAVVSLWTAYGDADSIPHRVTLSSILLAKLSTVANPLIYCILNKKFRPYVKSLMSSTFHNLRQRLIPDRNSSSSPVSSV